MTDDDLKDAINQMGAKCSDCGGKLQPVEGQWSRGEQCEDCGQMFTPKHPNGRY